MISFSAGALSVVLFNMKQVGVTEKQAAIQAVEAAGRVLRDLVKQNISLTDHSLADLAAEGHPYARRHGGIKIHQKGTKALTDPANRVHRQSGKLLSALKAGSTNRGLGYRVELDPSVAPHAAHVILGTRVMLPRDVIWDTAAAPDVQKRMMRAMVGVLGKKLRTKGGIRFGGGGPGPGALGV